METEKSQDLHIGKPETQGSPWHKFLPESQRQGGKKDVPAQDFGQEEHPSLEEGQSFCSIQSFHRLPEAHPHQGGQTALP